MEESWNLESQLEAATSRYRSLVIQFDELEAKNHDLRIKYRALQASSSQMPSGQVQRLAEQLQQATAKSEALVAEKKILAAENETLREDRRFLSIDSLDRNDAVISGSADKLIEHANWLRSIQSGDSIPRRSSVRNKTPVETAAALMDRLDLKAKAPDFQSDQHHVADSVDFPMLARKEPPNLGGQPTALTMPRMGQSSSERNLTATPDKKPRSQGPQISSSGPKSSGKFGAALRLPRPKGPAKLISAGQSQASEPSKLLPPTTEHRTEASWTEVVAKPQQNPSTEVTKPSGEQKKAQLPLVNLGPMPPPLMSDEERRERAVRNRIRREEEEEAKKQDIPPSKRQRLT
ncbi:MAG: hypothetical protein Q9194_001458 [Teloschistes cf. exilis]